MWLLRLLRAGRQASPSSEQWHDLGSVSLHRSEPARAEMSAVFEEWWAQATEKLSVAAGEWQAKWQRELAASCGGVRSTDSGVRVHLVLVGDPMLPLELWRTKCGWRFGCVPHRRVRKELVDCRTCLGVAGDAGGGSAC